MHLENAELWEETEIGRWGDFIEVTEKVFREYRTSEFFFRGQSKKDWGLRPTLLRARYDRTDESRAIEIEQRALTRFKQEAHLYDEIPRNIVSNPSLWDPAWWAFMQHHHVPTRLLDWTYSPFVALYFAVEKDPDFDGAVWYFSWTEFSARQECIQQDENARIAEDLGKPRRQANRSCAAHTADAANDCTTRAAYVLHQYLCRPRADHWQVSRKRAEEVSD